MKIKAPHGGIVVSHNTNPSFKLSFGTEPVEVSKEIADFLIKNNGFIPVGKYIEPVKVEGDLNKDGKFDKKDLAIAGRTLAKGRKIKRRDEN